MLSSKILDTIAALVVVLDEHGRIMFLNGAAEQITGYSLAKIRGRPIWHSLILPEEIATVKRVFSDLKAHGSSCTHVNHWRTKAGGRRLISWKNATLPAPDGRGILILGTGIDITEQKQDEDALRESEARSHAVLRTAISAIITIDERGIIESINPAAERMFGYALAELHGRSIDVLMAPSQGGSHAQFISDYLRSGAAKVIGIGREVLGRRKDGAIFPIDLAVSEVPLKDRRLFTGIMRDLSERRRLEREILEISTQEQRRIGQELHDGLCQDLAAVAYACAGMQRRLSQISPAEAAKLEEIGDLVDHVITDARNIARGLQPIKVDPEGLATALDDLARKTCERFGIECSFTAAAALVIASTHVATHLYHITQEAISNAIRHGRASRISIHLAQSNGQIALTIRNNGKPFQNVKHRTGMGLHIMSHRASVMGGSFSIEAGTRSGATVRCVVPQEIQRATSAIENR